VKHRQQPELQASLAISRGPVVTSPYRSRIRTATVAATATALPKPSPTRHSVSVPFSVSVGSAKNLNHHRSDFSFPQPKHGVFSFSFESCLFFLIKICTILLLGKEGSIKSGSAAPGWRFPRCCPRATMARDRILSNPLYQEGARPTSQHNFYQEEKTALERKRNGASKPHRVRLKLKKP
jgi:hypothetical protein